MQDQEFIINNVKEIHVYMPSRSHPLIFIPVPQKVKIFNKYCRFGTYEDKTYCTYNAGADFVDLIFEDGHKQTLGLCYDRWGKFNVVGNAGRNL